MSCLEQVELDLLVLRSYKKVYYGNLCRCSGLGQLVNPMKNCLACGARFETLPDQVCALDHFILLVMMCLDHQSIAKLERSTKAQFPRCLNIFLKSQNAKAKKRCFSTSFLRIHTRSEPTKKTCFQFCFLDYL
jgi:hypothetical protein